MAIDDLIANGIRPPVVDDPTTTYGKLMQIQAQHQAQQSGAIDLRLKEQGEKDQQTIRQAYMESGGDPTKFKALVMQRGASPAAIQQIEQHQLTMRKSYADLDKVDLENEQTRHEKLRGELTSFLGQAPEYKAANWQPWIQSHVQNGHLSSKEAADLLGQYPQYPGDEQGKLYANGLTTGIELAKEAAADKTAAARAQTAATGTQRLGLETPGIQAQNQTRGMAAAGQSVAMVGNQAQYDAWRAALPENVRASIPSFYSPAAVQMVERAGMTADQRAQVDQAKINATQTDRHNRVEEGQGAGRLAVERAGQALREKTFNTTIGAGLDANGRPLPADEMMQQALADPVAVAIADYREKPPSGAVRGGATSPLMRKVQLLSKNTYDENLFDARHKTALDYTPAGKEGANLKAADTALAHLDALSQAGKALQNGDIQVLNKIANYLGTQTGSEAQTVYNGINGMVSPEISRSVIGAVGGEGEREHTAKTYADFANDKTREAAIGATAALLGKRVEKSVHAYEQQMGKPLAWKLSDESQRVYDRYTGKPAADGAAPAFKVGDTVMYQNKPHKVSAIKDGKLVLEN